MNNPDQIERLLEIIGDFRKDEIGSLMCKEHVARWLSQFSKETRAVVLSEIIHIFEKWYISHDQIDNFIGKIVSYLSDQLNCTQNELFSKVCFISKQSEGVSQKRIIDRLVEIYSDNEIAVNVNGIDESLHHYVYMDDGLYTGSRARKDLMQCLKELPPKSDLHVFYVIAASNGLRYVEDILNNKAKEKEITLYFQKWLMLYNDKEEFPDRTNPSTTSHRYNTHSCLWPSVASDENVCIREYREQLQKNAQNAERHPYRDYQWHDDPGVFTCVEHREIVEREFLLHGIEIVNSVATESGMYPLGYNLWPSFGFGSICAFDMNISNTCPLVLWWGNTTSRGNTLDNWYPLLPRRANSAGNEMDFSDIETDYDGRHFSPKDHDQYNMCPDCGRFFGICDDGGNGFCIDCAWKH